ncbi:transketolase family protein [Dickeya zeae]|uniref:Transketolase n=1 Tax=Dickeya zeae TaxID=204042 RepID=A0ABX8VRX0_9GAMM|nr:transketolase C-terminal domain-containing protein [Dickeya zeae]MCO7261283.1 transketolase [Dickeya zeae]QYM90537.1 transketolase [Dickeya zeae]
MFNINPATVRTWSMLGTRGTFGISLLTIAEHYPDIVALSADLGITSGLERFATNYPSRFYNVGIAEQNMIGVAAGLAAGGHIPFATSFANFIALRACEQVRHNMGYMNENVKLVGLASGFAMGTFGSTHHGIEDIAALRAIHNLTILSPADCVESAKMTLAAVEHDGPVYIRLTGTMRTPVVYKGDYSLNIGKSIELREGDDVCIVATGSMVFHALKAAELLSEQGVECSVINMHTIKPLDTLALEANLGKKLLVTVEEHSVIGGLGGAVAEFLADKVSRPRQLIIGIPSGYPHAGDYSYLLSISGLTASDIVAKIKKAISD